MPRPIDVAKVLHLAGEAKLVNLDIPLKDVAKSGLASFGANFDEPWDLICADWMTVIRRGPRFDATLEITELATSLRESLATLDKKLGGASRG
jgi:hypothetical protein